MPYTIAKYAVFVRKTYFCTDIPYFCSGNRPQCNREQSQGQRQNVVLNKNGGNENEKPNNHVRRLRLQTSQRKGMYLQTVKDYRNALQGLRNGSLLQKLRRKVIVCALCVAQWKLHRHLSGDCLCDSRFCFFFVKCASKKI